MKIKSIIYLLFNLKLTIKVFAALYRESQQTVQELCNSIGTDDDLLITKIITELQIIKVVKCDKYVLKQLEDTPAIMLMEYSLIDILSRKNDKYNLRYRIIEILEREEAKKGLSIPQLCEETGAEDEYVIMDIIAGLENKKIVALNGFKKIYREDGGTIHLALYSISSSVQH